jgi:hypothetical protein
MKARGELVEPGEGGFGFGMAANADSTIPAPPTGEFALRVAGPDGELAPGTPFECKGELSEEQKAELLERIDADVAAGLIPADRAEAVRRHLESLEPEA